jgi:hypothetical protein
MSAALCLRLRVCGASTCQDQNGTIEYPELIAYMDRLAGEVGTNVSFEGVSQPKRLGYGGTTWRHR